jgi:hypothetical protein
LALAAVVAVLAAPAFSEAQKNTHRQEVEKRWLSESRSGGKKRVLEALALADRTLAYVQETRKLPAQAAELQALRREAKSVKPEGSDALFLKVRRLRRRILFAHPALDFEQILVNRNPPTTYSHNGDQHLGRHSRVGPGLTILANWKEEPRARAILEGKLPKGATRNPDLHYDAEKVVFAFCDHTRPGHRRFFLYEAAIDGSWVRQLTGTRKDNFKTWDNRATVLIEDNDPCYLPDDHIIFISTRGQTFGRCHGGRYNPAWILYRCRPDGLDVKQLSFANENEYEPAVLNDGRIVFTRWEYTNRHEMLFHMLWACRPDGSAVTHFYGNDTIAPMEVVETTPIPGTHRVVATAQGHHSYNTGTSVIIDTNLGENGEKPLTHITPETPYSETHGWPKPHFSHPYPVNEELYLVSRANHRVHPQGRRPPVADRAVYLIDVFGGREFLYEDFSVASFSPIPVRRRKRPPVLPSTLPAKPPPTAVVFLQNVYLTRNDPEGIIKPGMIKAVRVNALGTQPRARRRQCSVGCPNEIPKKVLGTVPVDEDGSACFTVPANTSLQMQSLDENGMAILTELSLFYLQPGEKRSCIGCHEPFGATPTAGAIAKMERARPVALTPAAGPQYPGGLSFMRTVQPVLDRYCIRCHGLGLGKTDKEKKANKINLVHDGRSHWPRSYMELVRRGNHRLGDKGYMGGGVGRNGGERNISRPRRYFAYGNKVAHMIVKNHGRCDMDRESKLRIIEWLDLNAQCYGDYFPNKVEERRIDGKAMTALRAYVKQLFGEAMAAQPERALINPAQPDESRVLMAPLPAKAGGWGQMRGYRSKTDLRFKKMEQLVAGCIVKRPNENTRGWTPTLTMGAGERWILEERRKFLKSLRSP